MPKVQVVSDDGHTTLLERVTTEDLEGEHFRARLAERIAWATADAEREPPPDEPA